MNAHLFQFAAEFHWTPGQVWALEMWQLVEFCTLLDRLVAERKQARSAAARPAGKRRRHA